MPRKKSTGKKSTSNMKTTTKKSSNVDVNKLINITNKMQGVSLQMVESNHELSKRIDKLVSLFEIASNNVGLAEEGKTDDDSIKYLTSKIEELVDQNRSLAEGLLLLEKYVRRKSAEFPALGERALSGL